MLEKINEILSNLRQSSGQEAQMKVCMMGPRAVGKTTVLTAMFSETQEKIAESKLYLSADTDTSSRLQSKKNQLSGMFERKDKFVDKPQGGIEASNAIQEYDFKFGVFGKDARINLTIKDFPGEFVKSDPEQVKEFISESNAIIIAVDTPYIMEENGKYAIQKNAIAEITDFFKATTADLTSEKLILIVPLKCEKYYYAGKMDEVLQTVKKYYAALIEHLSSQNMTVCAVTPILTLGGVEFDTFALAGSTGTDNVNVVSQYKYTKEGIYDPMYCVQPIYYLLMFVAAQYERNKNRNNIFQRFIAGIFEFFDNEQEFIEEVLRLKKYLNKDRDGYSILVGKELLKSTY